MKIVATTSSTKIGFFLTDSGYTVSCIKKKEIISNVNNFKTGKDMRVYTKIGHHNYKQQLTITPIFVDIFFDEN